MMSDNIMATSSLSPNPASRNNSSLAERNPCPIERHFHGRGMDPIHRRCLSKFKSNRYVKEHLKLHHRCTCSSSRPCTDGRHVSEELIQKLYDMKRRGRDETSAAHWWRICEIVVPHNARPEVNTITADLLLETLAAPDDEYADMVDEKLREIQNARGGSGTRPWELFRSQAQELCRLLDTVRPRDYPGLEQSSDETVEESGETVDYGYHGPHEWGYDTISDDGMDMVEQFLNL